MRTQSGQQPEARRTAADTDYIVDVGKLIGLGCKPPPSWHSMATGRADVRPQRRATKRAHCLMWNREGRRRGCSGGCKQRKHLYLHGMCQEELAWVLEGHAIKTEKYAKQITSSLPHLDPSVITTAG